MKNSLWSRSMGLSLCLFLYGATAQAALSPEVAALLQQYQPKTGPSCPSKNSDTSQLQICIPEELICKKPRPEFTNLSWTDAGCEGVKKTLSHAVGMAIFVKLPSMGLSYLAPSWFSEIATSKILASSALYGALTILSLRYKKQVMQRFETEESWEKSLSLASHLLPELSGKMLSLAAAGALYFALSGPAYS